MVDFSNFGVVCRHPRLEWLAPVMRRWGHYIDDYCELHPHDTPYYYSEWTNVGVLAAAAWGPGSGSIQEYACRRTNANSVQTGRADLYLYDASNCATVEAKQIWGADTLSDRHVTDALARGSQQAVTNRDSDTPVAAVFLTVMIPEHDVADTNAVTEVCSHILSQVEQSGAHAWAWAFPPSKRPFVTRERASDARFYWPGVVLALRVAHGNFRR
ncbi:MAG: hypothetical protein HYU59_04215 [Magnetospirillum gryphiswaldense]|nr:hypothetical protein [Magnetospirillum gryphiswaldense]